MRRWGKQVKRRTAPLWDLPTRIFHWSLVALLGTAWASVELGEMRIHAWCGYSLIVLVSARIVWGLCGSHYSRFGNFLRGPTAVWRYLRGIEAAAPGHNPIGGWSVVLMLLAVLAQGITGLFNADDISFKGPLRHTISRKLAGTFGEWHEINFNLLLALVALHVLAIAVYRFKGRNLVAPMIGGGTAPAGTSTRPAWLALLILLACGGLLYLLLSSFPPPPPFL